MYLPSLVHSLSEVAFSEPARSTKLCAFMSASGPNTTRCSYQHRYLNASPIPSLQPRSSRGLGPESGGHPSRWRHPSTSVCIVVPPGRTTTSTFSTLDNNAEDAVTPATPLVPVRDRCPPIPFISLQDLLDTREVGHNFFSDMSSESQTFGTEPRTWAGWGDEGARGSMMVWL